MWLAESTSDNCLVVIEFLFGQKEHIVADGCPIVFCLLVILCKVTGVGYSRSSAVVCRYGKGYAVDIGNLF